MARIHIRGSQLYAGETPWRAWGMNWGVGDHQPVLDYFEDPSARRLALLSSELHTAHRLGANSMRVPLEFEDVMSSPTQARAATLAALRRLLLVAERERVYLDITGNIVWRRERAPAWYDRLSEPARWQAQANFWRAVAHTAASSPAVLCYELTSEPILGDAPGYYLGELSGLTFVQKIANLGGRNGPAIARAWTRQLADAVRSEDDRPVTIGLMRDMNFTPANLADLLDMLVVHEYPRTGKVAASVALIEQFARYNKPVLLGETFPLLCDLGTERAFLLSANSSLVGVLEFFDGRDPNRMETKTIPDAIYQLGLRQFIALREILLAGV
jgi:hypothetical protein